MINQKQSVLVIGIVIVSLFGLAMMPYASASEHETQDNSTEEGVEIGVGQSLSIAIDSTSSDVEQQVDEVSRNRELGQASNPQERAQVLSRDLNQTLQDARNVRTEYQNVVQEFKEDEISQREFVSEVSQLANSASRVESNTQNIEYAAQFMADGELSQSGVTDEKIAEVRDEVGVVGSGVAANISSKSVAGANIRVNANEKSIETTIQSNNGSVYEGKNEEKEAYEGFNLTADEAIEAVEEEFGIDTTGFEVDVEEDDDYTGYYKVEAENSTTEYEVIVNGNNGEIAEFEKEIEGEGRNEERGNQGENEGRNDERENQGEMNRSERGDIASGTQGSPPWAEYEDETEDEEENETEENETEDEEENETEENETEVEAELSVEIEEQTNANATVLVTEGGESVADVEVLVNGVVSGETGAEGELEVVLPDVPEVEITARDGDKEAEAELEQEETEDETEDEEENETEENETEVESELSVEIEEQTNANATVLVTDGNEPAADVEVLVNGVVSGETGAEGELEVVLPDVPEVEITARDGDREAEVELEQEETEEENETDENETEEDESVPVGY